MGCKISLISPSTRATSRKLPLSLLSLAGYVEEYVEGVKAEIIDIKTKPLFKMISEEKNYINNKIIQRIKNSNPDVIGFTVLFSDVLASLKLAGKIKTLFPDKLIIAGGVQSSYNPKEILFEGSPFDLVVVGEGERTLKEILEIYSKKKKLNQNDLKKIKGIAYLSQKNDLKETPKRELIEDLDEIPMIPYEKVNTNFYFKPELTQLYYFLISSAILATSRGCPGRCTFCTGKDLWNRTGGFGKMRSYGVKRIVDELEVLIKKYHIDGLFFQDESFTYDKARVEAICNEIIKRKLKFIWQAQTRAHMIDENLVKLMKKAGCIQICFGFESGSQESLNRMKKGITVKQIWKAIGICKKYKMRIFACFMINTPEESLEDIEKTKQMIRKMDESRVYYNFAITLPLPGAQLYEDLGKNKFEKEEYWKLSSASDDFIRNDKRINLSKHNLDLPKELYYLNRKYNTTLKRILMFFDKDYLRQMLRSKRKIQYVKEVFFIFKFLLHKFATGEKAAN